MRLLPLMAIALLLSSCDGRPSDRALPRAGRVETGGVAIPNVLVGLEVRPENVAEEFEGTEQSYVAMLGLFSLREDDLVRATLQVSTFNNLARPKDPTFRRSIINRMGTTRPRTITVSNTPVFVTTQTDQNIFVWFEEEGFFVLTTHREFEFPRTLLRRVIDTKEKL